MEQSRLSPCRGKLSLAATKQHNSMLSGRFLILMPAMIPYFLSWAVDSKAKHGCCGVAQALQREQRCPFWQAVASDLI
jgi:hypothetical protein